MLQLAGTLAGVNRGETASPYAVEPWSGWVGEKMVKSWAKAGQKLSKLAMALLQEILLDEKKKCQQPLFYPFIFSSNSILFSLSSSLPLNHLEDLIVATSLPPLHGLIAEYLRFPG